MMSDEVSGRINTVKGYKGRHWNWRWWRVGTGPGWQWRSSRYPGDKNEKTWSWVRNCWGHTRLNVKHVNKPDGETITSIDKSLTKFKENFEWYVIVGQGSCLPPVHGCSTGSLPFPRHWFQTSDSDQHLFTLVAHKMLITSPTNGCTLWQNSLAGEQKWQMVKISCGISWTINNRSSIRRKIAVRIPRDQKQSYSRMYLPEHRQTSPMGP